MNIADIDFNSLIGAVTGKPGPGSGTMPPGRFNRYNVRRHLWPDEDLLFERTNEQVIDILEDKFDKAVDEQLFYQVINILEDMGYKEYSIYDEMGDQITFEIDQEVKNELIKMAGDLAAGVATNLLDEQKT